MVKYIDQQQWSQLVHVVAVGLEDIDEFFTVKNDGLTFGAAPMYTHLCSFKSFLLYYKSKTCWGEGPTDDDVMNWTPKDFKKYCSSKAYHDDYAAKCPTNPLKISHRDGIYGNIR
jgi:hypothetical protein